MKGQVILKNLQWLGRHNPAFTPGSVQTAVAELLNPTSSILPYSGHLCLGEPRVVCTGTKYFNIDAGATKNVNFQILMPTAEGTYPVHLDIFKNSELLETYRGAEDVVIGVLVPAGEISAIRIWSESLVNWGFVYIPSIPGVTLVDTVALNEEVYLVPYWKSKVIITGHIDLTVTYPDGTSHPLTAMEFQDYVGIEHGVRFEPFLSSQEGTYTIVVTLSSAGQVLDSVGFPLTAGKVAPPPPVYTCPYCGAEFATEAALSAHIETAHPPVYTCPTCDAKFATEAALSAHIATAHPAPEIKTIHEIADEVNRELGGSYVAGVLTPPAWWTDSVTEWSRHVQAIAWERYYQQFT